MVGLAVRAVPTVAEHDQVSAPRVGFVSLGCPKALVDSERILTQLRAEGYALSPSYQDADLVVVNTCGFIDSAVAESLEAIGEALRENGKVIVTGCLGAKADLVRAAHPSVLAVTGPHAYDEVMAAVHAQMPRPHDPYQDLVPPQGLRLTPRHYAYLKISEGCNHRCTFCIIPSMRGNLVSRPIGEVMQEAAVVLWRKFAELSAIEDFRRWAFGVAKFKALAFVRDRMRDRLVFDEDVMELLVSMRAMLRHCRQHYGEYLRRHNVILWQDVTASHRASAGQAPAGGANRTGE